MTQQYIIDGLNFSTLEEFFDEVSRVLIPGANWGRNLDAFDDILRGGFGTPSDGFVFRWINASVSQQRLGYDETIRQFERRLEICHPSSKSKCLAELNRARAGQGPTIFDLLVEIIRLHGSGGEEADDRVSLVLEA